MPLYTFYNKRSKKEFTEMMTISEMESYLKKNKHIQQRISNINIVAGVSGMSCLLYTSPSPRDISGSRMPSSA